MSTNLAALALAKVVLLVWACVAREVWDEVEVEAEVVVVWA